MDYDMLSRPMGDSTIIEGAPTHGLWSNGYLVDSNQQLLASSWNVNCNINGMAPLVNNSFASSMSPTAVSPQQQQPLVAYPPFTPAPVPQLQTQALPQTHTHAHATSQAPQVSIYPDKRKTRAETQIKVILLLDPLPPHFKQIHFPRKTLAKPKLLATPADRAELDSRNETLYMDLYLVCASALEKPSGLRNALRRARGLEPTPRRPPGIPISELDADDAAHPRNGGSVLICEGCKERERKRHDRKKKKADDEDEWARYEDDRIIMINEKEYKKLQRVDASRAARQVDFVMRIACYCRHQGEKASGGYCVVFTFKDRAGAMVAQHTSEVFQITDDHKNKEGSHGSTTSLSSLGHVSSRSVEVMAQSQGSGVVMAPAPSVVPVQRPVPPPVNVVVAQHQQQQDLMYGQAHMGHAPMMSPVYRHYPVESQYTQPIALGFGMGGQDMQMQMQWAAL